MPNFLRPTLSAIPIYPLTKETLINWSSKQDKTVQRWIEQTKFKASPREICLLPDKFGTLHKVIIGISKNLNLWDCGGLSKELPEGVYRFEHQDSYKIEKWALGWALGSYSFDRYKKNSVKKRAQLTLPKNAVLENTVEAVFLIRDLINTPASDMGPKDLANAARKLAKKHSAKCRVIRGPQLLKQNYPSIHAVGRAVETADQAPCLIDLHWGESIHPKLTLVGKGVCFDTGGLDLKPASAMKLMKKDMGGAANVLGLAHMIMAAKLKINLRVLIPAVENNISGNAMRPLDIITTRSGKTIEIGNTDAEGRVILADALTEAASDKPDLIIDFATLTGAARVALGAELPAFFTNDDKIATALSETGKMEQDPVWRLPLWKNYRKMIIGKSAHLTNSPESGFAGSITAALFLQEFIKPKTRWAHFDLMAWNLASKAGRPEGGEAMAVRTIFTALKNKTII